VSITVIRPSQRVYTVPGIGIEMRPSLATPAASASWWVVSGKTCVAAYQPKGAASYAASKVNLAQPGMYNLSDPQGAVSWSAEQGWAFVLPGSLALLTGLPAAAYYTVLVNAWISTSGMSNGGRLFCTYTSNFEIRPSVVETTWVRAGRTYADGVNSSAARHTWGMAFLTCYLDGAAVGAVTNNGMPADGPMIGNRNGYDRQMDGWVYAVATYADELTAGEVATVSAAMAAL
jgi:hypothetical protein